MVETPIRDRKAQETRARITEAALELFVSRGYEGTTIDQIAEEAGVNRRTIFRHFGTKEAILFDHLAVKRDFAVGPAPNCWQCDHRQLRSVVRIKEFDAECAETGRDPGQSRGRENLPAHTLRRPRRNTALTNACLA